jgi:hypothetical protein
MKKFITVALLFILSIGMSNVSFAKQKHGTTAADQIEQVASDGSKAIGNAVSATTKAVGNAIDSGKAAVKTGVAVVDTSSNFRMMYNDVKSGIAGLASALKIGAEHVYIVIVKQQVVHAVSNLILVLILMGLAYFLYNQSRKTYKAHLVQCGYKEGDKSSNNNIDLDDSAKGVASVILGVLSAIALICGIGVFCTSYDTIIMGFINPEYGAMKDIMDFVKSATGK